jgi:hypothetical protein
VTSIHTERERHREKSKKGRMQLEGALECMQHADS